MKLLKQIYKYIILGIILIIIGCFMTYKIHNINYFSIDTMRNYESYVDGLVEGDVFILNKVELENKDYLEFNDIKLRNDFTNFTKSIDSTDTYVKYSLYDENKKLKASFWISKGEMYLDLYKSAVVVFNSLDSKFEDTDRVKFFEKKGITNDVELFKYLLKTKDKKGNIFTSVEDMKNNYAIHFLVSGIYNNVESISFIDGDYEGYILNYNMNLQKVKEVNIIKNSKRYTFTIIGLDYFTDNYVKDLLSTLVIE